MLDVNTLYAVIATAISIFGLFGIKGENLKEGGSAVSRAVKRDYAHQRLGIVVALAVLLAIVGFIILSLAMVFVYLQEPAKLIAQFLSSNGVDIPPEVSDFSSTTIAFAILIILAAISIFAVDAFLHGFGIAAFADMEKAAQFKRKGGGPWNWISIACLAVTMLLGMSGAHVIPELLCVLMGAVPIAPVAGYIIKYRQIKATEKGQAKTT